MDIRLLGTKTFYCRGDRNITLVTSREDNGFHVGLSVCRPEDTFCKRQGRLIATHRFLEGRRQHVTGIQIGTLSSSQVRGFFMGWYPSGLADAIDLYLSSVYRYSIEEVPAHLRRSMVEKYNYDAEVGVATIVENLNKHLPNTTSQFLKERYPQHVDAFKY